MKRALLLTIRLYQRLVSPLLLPACRYVPTCSEYAHQAVELHGSTKGAMLAAWRLLRCHPFSRGGYDPVPSDESLHDPAFMWARLHDATHASRERLDTRIPEGCNDNSPALQCRVAGTTRPQVPKGTTEI
ncbi:MAG: membrane protein insertion efficiency factor YidD [Terriglobales bacterium]|jgi:putative membrane protein insertion efficiency factor